MGVNTAYRFCIYSFWVLALVVGGCDDGGEETLARVGDVSLTRADYEVFVDNLSPVRENIRRDAQARVGYLQAMVDQELLQLEAGERGLYLDAEIRSDLALMARRRLAEEYQARVIAPGIEVAQEDLEREFVDSRLNQERLLSRILVRTPEDRDRVLAELAAGRSFAESLDPFVVNDAIAEGDGVVGWFNGSEAERRFLIPRRVFFTLPLNEVAEPVRLSRGWQIYRFLEERTPELADYYQEVYRLVRDRKWKAANQEELEQLKHKYGVQLHQGALEGLLDRMRNRSAGADGEDEVLYSMADGVLNIGQATAILRSQGLAGPPPDPTEAARLFDDMLLRPLLFERAARAKGWHEESEFEAWYEREEKKRILMALMASETTAKVQIADGEVEAFYAAEKGRFRTPLKVIIRELATRTAEAAAEFRRQLEAGTPIGRLLVRRDAETHGKPRTGELTLTSVLKPRYPVLLEAAFAARPGEWVGPLESKDGTHVVFEVIERREEQVEPFETARPRVESLLRRQRENEMAAGFIAHLREKYAERVVQYPDRLVADEESNR